MTPIVVSQKTRVLFDFGILASLAGMFFWMGTWKATQEANHEALRGQINLLSQQLTSVSNRPITAEADRRISIIEARDIDVLRRLDSIEAQNREILHEIKARYDGPKEKFR
jgi:hypothetical protein